MRNHHKSIKCIIIYRKNLKFQMYTLLKKSSNILIIISYNSAENAYTNIRSKFQYFVSIAVVVHLEIKMQQNRSKTRFT